MSVIALRDINYLQPPIRKEKKTKNIPNQTKDSVKICFYRSNVKEDISIFLYRPPSQSINTWYLIYTVKIYPNTNILVYK